MSDLVIDNNQKNIEINNNSPIKESYLQNKINGWGVTIRDFLSSIFGGSYDTDSPNRNTGLFNNTELNVDYSNKLTSMFTNTKVNVHIYHSKKTHIFTFPGESNFSSPILMKLRSLPGIIKSILAFPLLIDTIGMIESIYRYSENYNNTEDHIIFDESTKKFNIGITDIRVYISSGLLEILNNDDEVIALLISEIGENLMVGYRFFTKYAIGVAGVFLSYIFGAIAGRSVYNENTGGLFVSISMIGLILLSTIMLLMYITRRRRVLSDQYAAKLGYGEAFKSALEKMHGYIFDSSSETTAVKGLNVLDRIMHWLNKIGRYISNFFGNIGLSNYVNTDERERLAQQNIDNNMSYV